MTDEGHLPSDDGSPRPRRRVGPGTDGGGADQPSWQVWLVVAVLAIGGLVAILLPRGGSAEELTYSEFMTAVQEGQVESVSIGPDGRVEGERTQAEPFTTVVPTAVEDTQLVERLRSNDVEISARAPSGGGIGLLLANLLPFLLIGLVIWWFARRAQGQMGGGGFGLQKSKARRVTDADRPRTRFADVAGYDATKQEVHEVVDYLQRPREYRKVGAKGPKGVLLVGPPGTGKTLVARAVAGEAGVPFFSAAGSEFVEMIVGVGASRVRDLFEQARKEAPAIVFIDELDSIGRKRGGGNTIGSHNEQEQTLNQILSEMDGFDATEGVVVMAATNRAEMLDEALTRPGRFDRTIEVGLPTQPEREAILEVHTRSVATADDLDVTMIARATPGFSGADLRNLVNEAALHAVRHDRDQVEQADVDAARERLVLGQRLDSSLLRTRERERIAVHESGHAVIGILTDTADPVNRVTILPSGRALGLTEQLPVEEKRLLARDEMEGQLAVLMGGRVAERALTGQTSSGGANDLLRATQLARRMVAEFGMSEQLGPVGYGQPDDSPLSQRPFAESTQRDVDTEVSRILREAESTAEKLIQDHREGLEALVARLLEVDTVDGDVVRELLGVDGGDGGETP